MGRAVWRRAVKRARARVRAVRVGLRLAGCVSQAVMKRPSRGAERGEEGGGCEGVSGCEAGRGGQKEGGGEEDAYDDLFEVGEELAHAGQVDDREPEDECGAKRGVAQDQEAGQGGDERDEGGDGEGKQDEEGAGMTAMEEVAGWRAVLRRGGRCLCAGFACVGFA